MVQGSLLLLFLFCPLAAFAGSSIKLRINQNGLNYLAETAREILEEEVRAYHIPDMRFDYDGGHVNLMNAKLFSVELPRINVTIEDDKNIVLTTSGGAVNGRIRLQVIYYILTIKCTTSGDADLRFWNLNSRVVLKWKKDTPKPQLQIASCFGNLEEFKITLHGNLIVQLVGIFSNYIGRLLADAIDENFCTQAQVAVDKVNKILLDMPDLYPVTKEGKRIFSIQTENLKTTVGPNFLDVTGNAVFLFKNKKCTAVIQQEFPETPVTHMASAWGSQGIPDCLLHAFHESNQLQYLITSKTAGMGSFLRTSCPSGNPAIPKCMGDVFPDLAQTYPNKSVEILAFSTAPPNVTIEKKGVKIIGFTVLNMILDSSVMAQFELNLTTIFDPILLPERLNGTIRVQNISLRLASSATGEMNQQYRQAIIKIAAATTNLILKPYADKGFQIPVYMGIKIGNYSSITMDDGFLVSDVNFYHDDYF